jgi:hypothetical protein
MEVRIDVRKLQLLNDRVNQCIDALNDVRGSVRSIGVGQNTMFGTTGFQHTNPFVQPFPGTGFQGQGFYGATMGLSHSDPRINPYVNSYVPYLSQGFGPTIPWTHGGLSHSDVIDRQAADLRATDLFRIAQTFPYAWVG